MIPGWTHATHSIVSQTLLRVSDLFRCEGKELSLKGVLLESLIPGLHVVGHPEVERPVRRRGGRDGGCVGWKVGGRGKGGGWEGEGEEGGRGKGGGWEGRRQGG